MLAEHTVGLFLFIYLFILLADGVTQAVYRLGYGINKPGFESQ
jgi:hypothetical protein